MKMWCGFVSIECKVCNHYACFKGWFPLRVLQTLLTSFYQLDDEARKEVVETIQFKLQYHKDAERAEQVKQIKGWQKKAPVNLGDSLEFLSYIQFIHLCISFLANMF